MTNLSLTLNPTKNDSLTVSTTMVIFKKSIGTTSICLFFVLLPLISICQNKLQKQIDKIAKEINGFVGISALVIETGETVSRHGDEHFPMQSVYKFPIAMAILDKVDKGTLTLNQLVKIDTLDILPVPGHSPLRNKYPHGVEISVRELLYYNISESDGTACDVLLRLLGGTQNATEYIHKLGVTNIAISTTEKVQVTYDTIQYKNWVTPNAMVSLLKIFYSETVLSPTSKSLLLKYMIESTPGPKRLKGLLPSGTIVAHKTGTSGTFNDMTRATNDVGVITLPNGNHIAIAVFVSDSYNYGTEREQAIAKISKAAFDFWSVRK